MFWNRKKPHKKAQILIAYLAVSMQLISGKLESSSVKFGCQIFILGMADMLRQAEKLDWEDFISIYSAVLEEFDLLPSIPIEDHVEKIGSIASQNEDVERLMRQGAQSISMYIVEKDANAPTDLLGAIYFVEKNEASFV